MCCLKTTQLIVRVHTAVHCALKGLMYSLDIYNIQRAVYCIQPEKREREREIKKERALFNIAAKDWISSRISRWIRASSEERTTSLFLAVNY